MKYEDKIKFQQLLQKVNIEKSIVGSKAFYINEDIEKGFTLEEVILKSRSNGYFSNDEIEKGKPAAIGEIRDWSGTKYRKVASGKWEEVREVGSGGVSLGISSKKDKTITQRASEAAKKQDENERRSKKRKEEAKKEKLREKYEEEYGDKVYEHKQELRDALYDLKQTRIDMEQEVASAPESEKDKVGNEYGERLNKLEEEISHHRKEINKYEKLLSELY